MIDDAQDSGAVHEDGDAVAGDADEGSHEEQAPVMDLSPDASAGEISPELMVAESLTSALRELRDSAERLSGMPMDEGRVEAAEQVAEDAASLDEQIGSVARSDEE